MDKFAMRSFNVKFINEIRQLLYWTRLQIWTIHHDKKLILLEDSHKRMIILYWLIIKGL